MRLATNDYILRNLILRFRAKTATINSAKICPLKVLKVDVRYVKRIPLKVVKNVIFDP